MRAGRNRQRSRCRTNTHAHTLARTLRRAHTHAHRIRTRASKHTQRAFRYLLCLVAAEKKNIPFGWRKVGRWKFTWSERPSVVRRGEGGSGNADAALGSVFPPRSVTLRLVLLLHSTTSLRHLFLLRGKFDFTISSHFWLDLTRKHEIYRLLSLPLLSANPRGFFFFFLFNAFGGVRNPGTEPLRLNAFELLISR